MPYVEWTEDMGEISGMGGGYEAACRAMVKAGVEFWDAQPATFDPKFHGYKNIYGVIEEDNADAKALSKVVVKACDGCSGAMHQATIGHILAFRRLGAEQYCRELREHQAKEVAELPK